MSHKTAYLWGPVSSFSGQLAAFLVQKGWHVHVATKGAFHIALSPLDLRSTAQECLEKALGGHERYKIFEERIRFLDVSEISRSTTYDAFVFCGLPPNFDEPRVSRAPWAAENFPQIAKRFRSTPTFIVSSLWGAIQNDGVVPEEIECERRKPLTPFEAVCQQYENKLLRNFEKDQAQWFLVRLPMMSGSTLDGRLVNFSGPASLYQKLSADAPDAATTLNLSYNPDATVWFLPVDIAVQLFWRLIEDSQRPRICNLVSTQTTLNQEWLQHLAKALGYKKATRVDTDFTSLPGFLKKALNDNVLIKTRGLFEVMGRYQQLPVTFDDEYFQRCIDFCKSENFGKLRPKAESNGNHARAFDEKIAREYFTNFLPNNLDLQSAKEATAGNTTIGFQVEDRGDLEWVLSTENGSAKIEPRADQQPKVKFCFTGQGMVNLVGRKVSLERALVMREARVEGHPMDILKACNFLKKFIKEHPFQQETALQDSAAK